MRWFGIALCVAACNEEVPQPPPRDAGLDARVVPVERPDAEVRDGFVAPRAPERVQLALGAVRGVRSADTLAFYGIRYAEPPVGSLRFAPPVAVGSWAGEFDATRPGPQCPQAEGRGKIPGGDAEQSEDCLRLNLWAPVGAKDAPVMVFVHGGKFALGSGLDVDGSKLSAAANAIVIGLNFRHGALGFLAHPAFDTDVPSGNLALRDQQLALRWVRDHVAAFGGDASKVTLFGESSGAQMTCHHLFAKGSENLFARAIMQSGTCVDYPAVPLLRDRVITASGALIDALCKDQEPVACMRAQSAETIAHWKPEGLPPLGQDFLPQVDGVLLTVDPWRSLVAGDFQRVPLILGTQPDEWAAVKLYDGAEVPRPSNDLELFLVAWGLYPDEALDVLAHYAALGADPNDVLGRFVSDSWFHCPARTLARGASAHGSRVYLYSFEVPPAVHAQELDYVFGYPWLSSVLTAPPFAIAAPLPLLPGVVTAMQAHWAAFARTGAPDPEWPRYDAQDRHAVFADPPSVGERAHEADCDFWDGVHERRHQKP